jgi:hypothetical protein
MELIALWLGNQHAARISAEIQRAIKLGWIRGLGRSVLNLERETFRAPGTLGRHGALRFQVGFSLRPTWRSKQAFAHRLFTTIMKIFHARASVFASLHGVKVAKLLKEVEKRPLHRISNAYIEI